ncbi:MAG: helix-turn-helix domain-containing protein [Pseudomonadota bacterium]
MPKLLCDTREAAEVLSVGRSKVYELLADGSIESVKIGQRRLVLISSMESYVASLRKAA